MIDSDLLLPFVHLLQSRLQEDDALIQVVLGPRQVGKTTGVLQCLEKFGKRAVYVSADDVLNPDASWILEKWQTVAHAHQNPILVIDEIQKIAGWSSVIKKIWDEQKRKKTTKLKLVLLGSSSLSLHEGLTESLTGRFEAIPVSHWDFVQSQKISPKMNLDDYLQFGGYPGSYAFLKNIKRWRDYVRNSIVDTVISKDILQFTRVRSPALFRQAFKILCAYPAQEISYNKILGQIQERGNVDLVKNYISLFEAAFLIKTLEKYSSKTVVRKSSSPKILPLCPALVSIGDHFVFNEESRGRLFEMAVGIELFKTGGELTYWRDGFAEVDYVLVLDGKTYAIEVKSSRLRNSKGMMKFLKKYPKAIPVFVDQKIFENGIVKFLEKL